MDALLKAIVGELPEPADQRPMHYRNLSAGHAASVVDGSSDEPSEAETPITEQPETPI